MISEACILFYEYIIWLHLKILRQKIRRSLYMFSGIGQIDYETIIAIAANAQKEMREWL